MLGRFAPGIRRADGPGQVTGDVSQKYIPRVIPDFPDTQSHSFVVMSFF